MPLYEYQCDSCGAVFERIQKFSDPPVEACPTCGGAVKKLVSSPAFQFKGSGWYVTDYAKKSGGPASSGESSGKADGSDKSDKPGRSDRSGGSEKSGGSETTDKPAAKDTTPAAAAPATTSSTNKDK